MRVRITIVGCSGSFPGPDGPASCYLVEAEGFRLLIDLGSGALSALQGEAVLVPNAAQPPGPGLPRQAPSV